MPGFQPTGFQYPATLQSAAPVVLASASSNNVNPAAPPPAVPTLRYPTWFAETIPSFQSYCVAYGSGIFVAGGFGGGVPFAAYSANNGATWQAAATQPGSDGGYAIGDIAYGLGAFVGSLSPTAVARSTDGINWAQVSKPSGVTDGRIRYVNGLFVILSSDLQISGDGGLTWAAQFLTGFSTQIIDIAFGNGVYAIVAVTGSGYSYNAATWYASGVIPWGAGCPAAMVFGNGLFVAVGNYAGITTAAYYSYDGNTWYATTMPSSNNWIDVIFIDGQFVAITANSTAVAVSLDGKTWAASHGSMTTTGFRRIAGNNAGTLVAAIYATTTVIDIASE